MLLQADTSLVNATLAIAIVTGVLALGTIATAIAALWQARSTAASVELQREELNAVKAQVKLTEDQLRLTREDFELARQQFELARDQAQQQLRQAEASTVMAREMKQERELAARPYLTVEILHPPFIDDLMVHNVGRGPALDCVWTHVGKAEPNWRRSKVFNVAPGTGRQLRPNVDLTVTQPGHEIPLALWDYGQLNQDGQHQVVNVHALFCQDETGAKLYRFIDGRVGYDVWQRGDPEPPWVTKLMQEFLGFRDK